MSYSYYITETLKDYSDVVYKMVKVVVVNEDGKFQHRAYPINLIVTDQVNIAGSFIRIISGNEKELHAYFTVDAFTGFSTNSSIKFGYGNDLNQEINNVNVQSIASLPPILSGIDYLVADNAWLESIS